MFIENFDYPISPQFYTMSNYFGYTCTSLFTWHEGETIFVLGDPFFRNYYIVLDYKENTIKLSVKTSEIDEPIRRKPNELADAAEIIAGIFSLTLLFLCCFYNLCQKGRNKSQKDMPVNPSVPYEAIPIDEATHLEESPQQPIDLNDPPPLLMPDFNPAIQ